MTWLILDESLTPEIRAARLNRLRPSLRMSDILSNAPLVLVLVIGFGTQIALSLMTSTLALFGEAVIFAGQSADAVNLGVGLLLACVGVGQFITQLFLIRRLVPRYGERRLVVVGSLLRAVAMLAMASVALPIPEGAALLLFAMASGMMMPSLQALATMSVPQEYNGAVLGYYQASITLGIISGTWLGGLFFAMTPTLPYVVGAAVLLLTLFPGVVLLRRPHPVVAVT
jgi:predicted MFS family arabinose efflux permease